MTKRWIITPRTHDDLIDQVIANRGVADRESFLRPDYQSLHDPSGLKNMSSAVDRLVKAIDSHEQIAVFGDYDHDGTPAAALLSEGIERCGGTVATVYIPTREEGYSISLAVVDQFAKTGISLMLLVDCGITNKPEVDYAKTKGIETIVIDHHVVQADKFPSAAIVVNPKQAGDTYPFKELCGCGLAFKVIQMLGRKTKKLSDDDMKWFLDLVAISTICDMVPLVDENRILVHYGLIVLQKTKRLGLRKLYEAASIDPATISTYTAGFLIGPRLNAPGRMERASIAYDLLVAKTDEEAAELALRLNELNIRRQDELATVLKDAESRVKAAKLHEKKVILVSGDGWPDGVVGLVAGRLTEKYGRPAIVLVGREDGLAKGSARSIDGFHLVESLKACEEYLVKYGGHAKAAGLTLAKEHLELLYDKLIEVADAHLSEEHLKPKITIDSQLRHEEVTLELARSLLLLEPHGLGNAKPIFLVDDLEVVEARAIGQQKNHLKLQFKLSNGVYIDGIAFNMASRIAECPAGTRLDVAGFLDINSWQNRDSVQLKLLDWRFPEKETHAV